MKFTEKSQPRVVYMGTPEISATVLRGMIEAGFNIVALICNEDRPVGRKNTLVPPPTKAVALEAGIPVYQPHRIRLDYEWLKEIKPDVIVTMAYGQIVPQGVLDIPQYGCINLHGSLLPKLRGAAPIQRAIMNGESVTGVTLMEMVDKMDAGRMYDKAIVPIDDGDNYSTLSEKIGAADRDLIIKDLLPYLNGELKGEVQEESQVTFANKIKPEDEHLPLSLSAEEFVRYVRGMSLTPGGYLFLDGKKLKILAAHVDSECEGVLPGNIVSDRKGLFIQVGKGVVSVDLLQLEGKKTMDAKSFVNGVRDLKGKVLE